MSLFLGHFGLNNFRGRGTIKTYSRQRALLETRYHVDRPRKRICMDAIGNITEENLGAPLEEIPSEGNSATAQAQGARHERSSSSSLTVPSSPLATERGLFSSDAAQEDDDSPLSSPPSSPPPLPTPKKNRHKPAFSFLKRKRLVLDDGSASEPLSDITHNVRKIKRPRKAMTQMQIDLGGEVRRTCRLCGMEYIPSVREDSMLHSKFCVMNVGGVIMGKNFSQENATKRISSEKAARTDKEYVVAVDRKSSMVAKGAAKKVLQVVNAELSSADIDDEHLWGALGAEKKVIETRRGSVEGPDKRADRFKAFLYLEDDKCVGFCLAEKISSAFPVVHSSPEGHDGEVTTLLRSSSISVSTTADIALLGISRIWVSKSHRGLGVATDLLNCARSNFFYGVEAPKDLVAFSQPTEGGTRLAKSWFGSRAGWHVYRGDQ